MIDQPSVEELQRARETAREATRALAAVERELREARAAARVDTEAAEPAPARRAPAPAPAPAPPAAAPGDSGRSEIDALIAEWAELETATFKLARAARSPALDPARRVAVRARELLAAARAGDGSLPVRAVRRGLGALRSPSPSREQPGEDLPLPDEDLIWRVTGARSPDWFHSSGQTSRREIEGALALAGVRLAESGRVLEFGCGCGRILRWMRDIGERAELHGVDIDGEAIAWAREHLAWAHVSQNPPLPPLDVPAEHFDVVFNHSVFTHLDVHYQDAWLEELRRVTRPGGVLLLTVTGQQAFEEVVGYYRETGQDHAALSEAYRTKGIVFIEDDMWKGGPFPDFYHSTFHAPWYVFEHWGSYFSVEAYLVRASLGLQDQVILRRR